MNSGSGSRFQRCAPCAVFSLLVFGGAFAAPPQDPPIEWGEIPAEDVAMNSFAADTNAGAVILCDYGETTLSNRLSLVFKRHTRIKILSTSGYSWGDQEFVIHSRNHNEVARDIEGATYAPGKDGKTVCTELDEKSVFKDEANEYVTRYRFTLPALQPGCVIEFRYTIETRAWNYIHDWVFQQRIPVRWSEYRVLMPHMIVFAAVSNKRFPFAADELTETTHSYSGDAGGYLGRDAARCYMYRWIVRDSPALRNEPEVARLEDYAQKMDLELAEYANYRRVGSESLAKTWDEAIRGLLEEEDFGKRMEISSGVRRLTDQVTAGLGTPVEKMDAVYDYVRRTIVWSGWTGMYSPLGSDDVIEARKGSVSQIAFLVVSMLRSAGIEADPVVLSSRSNGIIQTTYPVLHQFNYVVARAKIGGDVFYLDATDPLRPRDLLPADLQKVPGLVVKDGPVEWVALNSRRADSRRSVASLTPGPGGEIEGTVETSFEQYGALEKRRELAGRKPVDFAKTVLNADDLGFTVDSVRITGAEKITDPLVVSSRISSPSYAQVSGDLLYVNPAVVDRQVTNHFTATERKYPVNMPYGRRWISIVNIAVPEGFEVKELPPDQNIRVGSDEAVFTRLSQIDGKKVQVATSLVINSTDYQPGAYADIRKFFERVTTGESAQLVLARKSVADPKASAGTKTKARATH